MTMPPYTEVYMSRRYELTDETWLRLEPLIPSPAPGGQWNDYRNTLNGMF